MSHISHLTVAVMPPNNFRDADGATTEPCACAPTSQLQNQTCSSSSSNSSNRKKKKKKKELHIAPMLNYSTREFRQLLRILSRRAVVWTEMVVDDTVRHAPNLDDHLGYDAEQHPIVCQIGGNSPELCGGATAVALGRYGYDEVNLNIDCPSDRVSGRREFGAVLMKKAELAADIVREMQSSATAAAAAAAAAAATDAAAAADAAAEVSIKCRIGVDEWDDLEFAADFIRTLRPVCRRFYLHARKCVLDGLMNARQNRSVPPLNYPRVYELCRLFPDCEFWINGGIHTLEEARLIVYGTNNAALRNNEKKEGANDEQHGVPCDLCNMPNGSCIEPPLLSPDNLRGCMMGRAAMDDPCLFYDVDRYFYGEKANPCKNRRDVLEKYCNYLEQRYPRRCCSDGENYCSICADVYGTPESREDEASTLEWPTSTSDVGESTGRKTTKKPEKGKPKIASPIIARCLKPVQGMFNGIPSSRVFRRVCDKLGQNVTMRNCGPGYILRKAMQSVPPDILDREFGLL